jgi:HTH-type transcriptional regulator/antitoxin HigA
MSGKNDRDFQPSYSTPPGATLRETLESMGLSQSDLAERTGRPKKTINEIVQGKAAITPETALQLEQVLGIPASFWNDLERRYRASLAREAERKQLQEYLPWLSEFPVSDLVSRGWIQPDPDRIEIVRSLLRFFGVVSPQAWRDVWEATQKATVYRQSTNRAASFGAVAAWLRKGELEGRAMKCQPFEATKFRQALKQIRQLTHLDPSEFCPKIQELCAAAGVAVVFVQELPKARIFGAARWLAPDKALIQLSLYYKTEDQLWFSLFHEAGHVLLHGRREIFVDVTGSAEDRQEEEANQFAASTLIDERAYASFVASADFSHDAVLHFSKQISLVPGIVVGRLQHDKHIAFSRLAALKRRFDWA